MKCTVSPAAFSSALSLVTRAVSARGTLPVLGNVLLEVNATAVRMTATNLDLSITATVPRLPNTTAPSPSDEGRTTVPAKLLNDYVSSLAEQPLTMELDPKSEVLHLTSGPHTSNLNGIVAGDFPQQPFGPGATVVALKGAPFAGAIYQTIMAASSDEASPVLTGVSVTITDGVVTMVATDRHRLAVRKLIANQPGQSLPTVIVPAKHLAEVARAAKDRPDVLFSLSENGQQAFFSLTDVTITSRLVSGTFPAYQKLLPNGAAATKATLPTAELLREARTASVLAKDASNPVKIAVARATDVKTDIGTLTVSAETSDVGDDVAPLSCTVLGDDVSIAFNSLYLLQALAVLDSSDVTISFNGPLQPGVLRPKDGDDYLCLIMPVRVDGSGV